MCADPLTANKEVDRRLYGDLFRHGRLEFAARTGRVIAEGNLVTSQGTISGAAPSGERTEIRMPESFRLENGRIAERRR